MHTEQATALVRNLPLLEQPHGIAMSRNESGLQWDFPYGWAPCNWLVIDGLSRYGYRADAIRIAQNFATMVEKNYAAEGTIREKYDVVTGSTVAVQNGYSANVTGFGWTNGVYLMIEKLLKNGTEGGPVSPAP
jgi:alpha,alpha-trehalase